MQTDTLYIKAIKSDGNHNYLSEINPVEYKAEDAGNNSQVTSRNVENFLEEFMKNDFVRFVSIAILLAIVALIIYNIIKRYSFIDPKVETEAAGMGNDTIYGHSWEDEMKEMMNKGNFSEAVVLCYLHLLEKLNKKGVIRFMTSKTPNMFLEETKAYTEKNKDEQDFKDFYPQLQTLTKHYLLIRYGHKTASEQLAKEMINEIG